MRTFRATLFGLTLIFAAAFAQAQTTTLTDPVKYNDFIVEQQNNIGKEILIFNDIVGADADLTDRAGVDAQLKVIQRTCRESLAKVKGLQGIKEDWGLKKSAIRLFEFYNVIFENEYVQMIDVLYSPNPDLEAMESILGAVSEREGPLDLEFQQAQGRFAKENGFDLIQNELQKELDETGDL